MGRIFACLVPKPYHATAVAGQQSGIDASVHGLILMNAFHTSDDVNNSDVPQFVLPAGEPSRNASSATVRQSRVTVTALVPEFAGGQLTGELDVDFFGGQQPSTGGRTFPLLRIRKAFAELTWSRFALLVGQEAPPIAEVNPSSIASIGFPLFAGAGNLWLWIPQVRVSADLPVERHQVRRRGGGAGAYVERVADDLLHSTRRGGAQRATLSAGPSPGTLGSGPG